MMIIRSKAPLRLGLAGGGTDVSPYSDLYGGAILNATINMFAYTTLEPTDDGKMVFESPDRKLREEYDSAECVDTDGFFVLHKGVYNRIVRQFTHQPLSFRIASYVDVPPGSGLGTSSTLVVSILGAFVEWLKLPLGEYDIARLAYEIERVDLGMSGGKQDQYAATFGGFNFMEFNKENVIVNPLRIRNRYADELAHNLVLYYTDTSHVSAEIIEEQQKNVRAKNSQSIEAMHKLKEQAVQMKEALLRGNIDRIGEILDFGWRYKKQMASSITNPRIDGIYNAAKEAGASGGKISGAGGGGFMFFYCPGVTRYAVVEALQRFGGKAKRYEFVNEGLKTWTM
ncbi:MAG: dehydrogenase [Bacteroidales bacterium]|nr:dehydrogenase [Bacteroidales bacterium]MBQ2489940.1 dehydrogenase [Bacteroidales bacterium]MBQ5532017.1 dehydrogenase [Bacteroidales bacterium]MBR6919628.1 dehydrogenase [Bacteroidales bacterium]